MKGKPLPEIVLVKKTYPRYRSKIKDRSWKLQELETDGKELRKNEQAKLDRDRELFYRDLEEDKDMRSMVNIYKDETYFKLKASKHHKRGKNTKLKSHVKSTFSVHQASSLLDISDDDDEEDDEDIEEDFPMIHISEMLENISLDTTPLKENNLLGGNVQFNVGSSTDNVPTSSFGYPISKPVKIEDLADLL